MLIRRQYSAPYKRMFVGVNGWLGGDFAISLTGTGPTTHYNLHLHHV
jgi:hypothetical protein